MIFSGINSSVNGLIGALVYGSYNPETVKAELKAQKLEEQNYRGRSIYFNPTDRSYVAFLRAGALVVGSQTGVEGIIDAEMKPRLSPTLRPPFSTIFRRFTSGRQPISFAMALPLEYQVLSDVAVKVISALFSFSGLGPLGYVIDKVGFPHAIGFAIARRGNDFPTDLVAKMKDEYSAALISGTLGLAQAINLNSLSGPPPSREREMLKDLSVTRNGALLSIRMTLREEDLRPASSTR